MVKTRTKLSDLGFQPRRVRLVLTHQEWAALENEADRRAMPLGSTISTIVGLSIANREDVNTLTQQIRDDSSARNPRGTVR